MDMGANAVINLRMATSQIHSGGTGIVIHGAVEVLGYGVAVVASKKSNNQ